MVWPHRPTLSREPTIKRLSLAFTAIAASTLWVAPFTAAFAQGSSSFPLMTKKCPSHFTERKGMCVAQGDWVGFHNAKRGQCPSGYSSASAGDYCIFSANKTAGDDEAQSQMENGNWTFARRAVTARVPKAGEADFCPTGYFTHRTDLKLCVTHYDNAPQNPVGRWQQMRRRRNPGVGPLLHRVNHHLARQ